MTTTMPLPPLHVDDEPPLNPNSLPPLPEDGIPDERPDGEALPPSKSKRARGLSPAAYNNLVQLHAMLGMGINTAEVLASARKGGQPDHLCGNEFISQADVLTDALDKLAQADPKARKVLEGLAVGGAWGAVLTAYFPVVMSIVRNHNKAFRTGVEMMSAAPEPEAEPQVVPTGPIVASSPDGEFM